jgi:hypothetical protein
MTLNFFQWPNYDPQNTSCVAQITEGLFRPHIYLNAAGTSSSVNSYRLGPKGQPVKLLLDGSAPVVTTLGFFHTCRSGVPERYYNAAA